MGLHNELPVYKASYDLLLEIFQFTKDFSKDFKYTVGERSVTCRECAKRKYDAYYRSIQ